MEKNEKMSVAEIFAKKLCERAEKEGYMPWQKPWIAFGSHAYNAKSGRVYSGINEWILDDGGYLTFKEITELGGKIRKGAKAYSVFFWKQFVAKDKETDEEKIIPFLRYYNVFALSDCESIDTSKLKLKELDEIQKPNKNAGEGFEEARDLILSYTERENIPLTHDNKAKAYYSPTYDRLNVPDEAQFVDSESYFQTVFHEVTHSTGHQSRLNRKLGVRFGSEKYAKEELIAEIGSGYLCSYTGIDLSKIEDNSTAYLQSWCKAIKNDPQMLIVAMSKARKAFEFVIGKEKE